MTKLTSAPYRDETSVSESHDEKGPNEALIFDKKASYSGNANMTPNTDATTMAASTQLKQANLDSSAHRTETIKDFAADQPLVKNQSLSESQNSL